MINFELINLKSMKILYDHQIFYPRYGGASKYFSMLISSLPRDIWQTTALFSSNEYVKATNIFKTYPYLFKGQALICEYLNRIYTKYCINRQDFDIFHQTNFGTYCLKDLKDKPMVTTYHDSNLSTLDPHPKIVARQAVSLMRSEAIITVSQNTKNDMLKLFDVDESKVFVVHHGIEKFDLSTLNPSRVFSFPYILYVGRRSKYKNFERFLRSFAVLCEMFDEVHLVCTSIPFSNEELLLIEKLGVSSRIHHIFASEDTMKCLFRDSEFFVYPSLYEGFGMPILEAWSCNCPVVLSYASCFPEIAGNAGLYFDPYSIDDMVDKMAMMLSDEGLRKFYQERGTKRVLTFSWEKCAQEHMNIYRSLL